MPNERTEALHGFLVGKKLYTKSLEDFETQFSTPESQGKLYEYMVGKKVYTKSQDDFHTQFFNGQKKSGGEDGGTTGLEPVSGEALESAPSRLEFGAEEQSAIAEEQTAQRTEERELARTDYQQQRDTQEQRNQQFIDELQVKRGQRAKELAQDNQGMQAIQQLYQQQAQDYFAKNPTATEQDYDDAFHEKYSKQLQSITNQIQEQLDEEAKQIVKEYSKQQTEEMGALYNEYVRTAKVTNPMETLILTLGHTFSRMPDQAKMTRAVLRNLSAKSLQDERDDFMDRVQGAAAAGFDPEARQAYVDKYGSVSLQAMQQMNEDQRSELINQYDEAIEEKQALVREAAMHVLAKREKEGKVVKEEVLVEQLSQIEDPVDVLNYVASATGEGFAQIPASVLTMGISSFIVEAGEIYADQLQEVQRRKSEELGRDVTVQEIIDNEWDDPGRAFMYGAMAAGLDRVGAGKVLSSLGKKKIRSEMLKRTKRITEGMATEFFTEGAQTALEQVGAGRELEAREILEGAVKGGVGAGPLSALSEATVKPEARTPQVDEVLGRIEESKLDFMEIQQELAEMEAEGTMPPSGVEIDTELKPEEDVTTEEGQVIEDSEQQYQEAEEGGLPTEAGRSDLAEPSGEVQAEEEVVTEPEAEEIGSLLEPVEEVVDVPSDIDEIIEGKKKELAKMANEEYERDKRGEENTYSKEFFAKNDEARAELDRLQAIKEGRVPASEQRELISEQLNDLNKPFLREVGNEFFPRKGTYTKGKKISEDDDLGGVYEIEGDGYLFRGVSIEDYQRIMDQGYIDTDNRGVISDKEGINLATNARTGFNYLPKGVEGVVLAIKIDDKSNLFMVGADDYVRSSANIPVSSIEYVTTPTIEGQFTLIKEGKTTKLGVKKAEVAEQPAKTEVPLEVTAIPAQIQGEKMEARMQKLRDEGDPDPEGTVLQQEADKLPEQIKAMAKENGWDVKNVKVKQSTGGYANEQNRNLILTMEGNPEHAAKVMETMTEWYGQEAGNSITSVPESEWETRDDLDNVLVFRISEEKFASLWDDLQKVTASDGSKLIQGNVTLEDGVNIHGKFLDVDFSEELEQKVDELTDIFEKHGVTEYNQIPKLVKTYEQKIEQGTARDTQAELSEEDGSERVQADQDRADRQASDTRDSGTVRQEAPAVEQPTEKAPAPPAKKKPKPKKKPVAKKAAPKPTEKKAPPKAKEEPAPELKKETKPTPKKERTAKEPEKTRREQKPAEKQPTKTSWQDFVPATVRRDLPQGLVSRSEKELRELRQRNQKTIDNQMEGKQRRQHAREQNRDIDRILQGYDDLKASKQQPKPTVTFDNPTDALTQVDKTFEESGTNQQATTVSLADNQVRIGRNKKGYRLTIPDKRARDGFRIIANLSRAEALKKANATLTNLKKQAPAPQEVIPDPDKPAPPPPTAKEVSLEKRITATEDRHFTAKTKKFKAGTPADVMIHYKEMVEELAVLQANRGVLSDPNAEATSIPSQEEIKETVRKRAIEEATQPIADFFRTKAKFNIPEGLRGTTGIAEAWNTAMDAIAKSIEAGAKFADAVANGIREFKKTDYYKNLEGGKKREAVETLRANANMQLTQEYKKQKTKTQKKIEKTSGITRDRNYVKLDEYTGLKERIKTLARGFRQGTSDTKARIQEIQKTVRKFVRENLSTRVLEGSPIKKSQLNKINKLLAESADKPESLNEALAELDKMFIDKAKIAKRKEIQQKLNRALATQRVSGVKQQKKMSARHYSLMETADILFNNNEKAAQKKIKRLDTLIKKGTLSESDMEMAKAERRALEFAGDRVIAMEELQAMVSELREKNMVVSNEQSYIMELLDMVGSPELELANLNGIARNLHYMAETGRTLRKAQQAAEEVKTKSDIEEALTVLTDKGRKVVLTEEQYSKQKSLLDHLKNLLEGARNIQESLPSLLESLSRFERDGIPFNSFLNNIGNMVAHADIQRGINAKNMMENVLTKAQEIMGINYSQALKENGKKQRLELTTIKRPEGSELRAEVPVQEETTVRSGRPGFKEGVKEETKVYDMSVGEASHYWQIWQQGDLNNDAGIKATFQKMGWTQQTIDQLENFITQDGTQQENLDWAEWQMTEFYPSYYPRINNVYRRLYGFDLPFVDNYVPTFRKTEGKDTDINLMDTNEYEGGMVNGSLKSRVPNTNTFARMNADDLMIQHIQKMEHFIHNSEVVNRFRKIFKNQRVRAAIEQVHGSSFLFTMDSFMKDMARGGTDPNLNIQTVDTMMSNFVTAKIGINLPVFAKQLTSFPAYMGGIAAKDIPKFIKYVGEFFTNPIKNWKELNRSEYLELRGATVGFDQILSKNAEALQRQGFNPKKMRWKDYMMLLTKFGDKTAIITGGYGYYRVQEQKYLKQGISKQKAKDMALKDFERQTTLNQQSSQLTDLSWVQRFGTPGRAFTMFQNSPLQYLRLEAAAITNIITGRGNLKDNIKDVIIYHFILPGLFQAVSAGFTGADEDDYKRTFALGSLAYILIAGDIAESFWDAVFKTQGWGMSNYPVALNTQLKKALAQVSDFKDQDFNDMTVYETYKAMDQLLILGTDQFGVPLNNVVRYGEGIYEVSTGRSKNYWRVAGWSDHALGQASRKSDEMGLVKRNLNLHGGQWIQLKREAKEFFGKEEFKKKEAGLKKLHEIYKTFGLDNPDVNFLKNKSKDNKERAEYLIELEEDMGKFAFRPYYNKLKRKGVVTNALDEKFDEMKKERR